MKRTQRDRRLLDESLGWLRDHWNATNLEVPEALRERWMYEPADDRANPAGFHLAVFTFGLMQHDLISNGVPTGVKRTYSGEMLLLGFARWQLKLALAEVHQRTDLRVRPLPLFAFPENEQIEAWSAFDAPTSDHGRPAAPGR